jgi:hypothetical protein
VEQEYGLLGQIVLAHIALKSM